MIFCQKMFWLNYGGHKKIKINFIENYLLTLMGSKNSECARQQAIRPDDTLQNNTLTMEHLEYFTIELSVIPLSVILVAHIYDCHS